MVDLAAFAGLRERRGIHALLPPAQRPLGKLGDRFEGPIGRELRVSFLANETNNSLRRYCICFEFSSGTGSRTDRSNTRKSYKP